MRDYALILSNDIADPERMLEVNKLVKDYVEGVKIGITSSMVPGVEIFQRSKEVMGESAVAADLKVLADYKVADIGFKADGGNWQGTNHKIVRTLAAAGTDYITCHTFPGVSSIEEAVESAHKFGAKVLTLPYMTHKGAELFFGMPIDVEQRRHIMKVFKENGLQDQLLVEGIARAEKIRDTILVLGDYIGVDGYIGPGNNEAVLRRYRDFTDDEIWSPGFGRQDKLKRSLEEQIRAWARVVGPKSAMIVGSLIYKADDPAAAAREVMETRDKVVASL